MRISRKRTQFSLLIIDIIILISSIFFTLWIRNGEIPSLNYFILHFNYFSVLILICIVLMYTLNFYSLENQFSSNKSIIRLITVMIITTMAGFAEFYLLPFAVIMPKTVLILYAGISLASIMLWRLIYDIFFGVVKHKTPVLFVGFTPTTPMLLSEMQHFSYIGFTACGLYESDSSRIHDLPPNFPILTSEKEMLDFIKINGIKTFVLAEGTAFPFGIRKILFDALEARSVFYTMPDFYETITRKIPLGDINEIWFMRNISFESKTVYGFFKRIFDIFFSLLLTVLTILFWPIIALIIKIESPGPIFFKQIREGKHGRLFKIYKFRTMKTVGNDFKPTGESDSRITPFGNFLRKSRVDELPQMLNVILGDMSLIGPRPERPELALELEKGIPYYRQRLMVKPGITGWDQVSGEYHSPSMNDTYKKLQYDLYYIKNFSFALDFSIFFKTVMTVLLRSGR